MASTRKHPITPELLLQVCPLFTLDKPLHATMWALFLVAFFTFLCKSNLVPDIPNRISSKVLLRSDLVFSSRGATLDMQASKTIFNNPLALHPFFSSLSRHGFTASSAAQLWSISCPTFPQLFSPHLSAYFLLRIVISALFFPRPLVHSV